LAWTGFNPIPDEPWVYVRAESNNPCRCACCATARAAKKYSRARERVNEQREMLG
jgi:hypothetical protein